MEGKKNPLEELGNLTEWGKSSKGILKGLQSALENIDGLSEEQKQELDKQVSKVPFDQAFKDIDNVMKEINNLGKL